jgi:hypothetical protein
VRKSNPTGIFSHPRQGAVKKMSVHGPPTDALLFESDREWQEFAHTWMHAWNDQMKKHPHPKAVTAEKKEPHRDKIIAPTRPRAPVYRPIPVVATRKPKEISAKEVSVSAKEVSVSAKEVSVSAKEVSVSAKEVSVSAKESENHPIHKPSPKPESEKDRPPIPILAKKDRQLAPSALDHDRLGDRVEDRKQIEGRPPKPPAAPASAASAKSRVPDSWLDALLLPHGPPDFRPGVNANAHADVKSNNNNPARDMARAAAAAGILTWVGQRCLSHAVPGVEQPSYWELGGRLAQVVLIESANAADSDAHRQRQRFDNHSPPSPPPALPPARIVAPPDLSQMIIDRIDRVEANLDRNREFKRTQDHYLHRVMKLATCSMAQESRQNPNDPIVWKTCPSCYESLEDVPSRACEQCHGLVCEPCLLKWWETNRLCMLCRFDPLSKKRPSPPRGGGAPAIAAGIVNSPPPPFLPPQEAFDDRMMIISEAIRIREQQHAEQEQQRRFTPSRLFTAMARPFRKMFQ